MKKIRKIFYLDCSNFPQQQKIGPLLLEQSFKTCIFLALEVGPSKIDDFISKCKHNVSTKNELQNKFKKFEANLIEKNLHFETFKNLKLIKTKITDDFLHLCHIFKFNLCIFLKINRYEKLIQGQKQWKTSK